MDARQAEGSRRKVNVPLVLFTFASMLQLMTVSQVENHEVGSLLYWVGLLPPLIIPLFHIRPIVQTFRSTGRSLLFFLVLGGGWHLLKGDIKAAYQLALLICMLAIASSNVAVLSVRHLIFIYLAMIGIGVSVYLFTDFNRWGILPFQTPESFSSVQGWAISFYPNIANSGILSFAMFLILSKDFRLDRRMVVIWVLVLYFMIFSFNRTALIGAMLYLGLRWLFTRNGGMRPRLMLGISTAVALGTCLFTASSAILLQIGQKYPIISKVLLKNATNLSREEILSQLYRPWLWGEHLKLFATSPWMMGWGSFDFFALLSKTHEGLVSAGSESLPTRLLASYGLAAVFFLVFLFTSLRSLARQQDRWACACFPSIFFFMMSWGGVFHPTDALLVVFTMIIVRGKAAFIEAT